MACAFEPRLEVYVTVVVKIGITPFGIFIIGETVLDDAHHIFRIQHVAILKVARTAYFITYPIPLATTIK